MATKIQLRRDLAANWAGTNPVLAQGEPGVELDTKKMKVGDGVTAWNSLAYVAADSASQGTTQDMFVRINGTQDDISAPWSGVIQVSEDGLNWTPSIYNEEWTGMDQTYVYNLAVGGGRIVYVVWEDSDWSGQDRYSLRWAYNAFDRPKMPSTDNVQRGPNGEDVYWYNVRYVGDRFIAVGYYYDNVRNDYYYPIAVTSTDGDTWTNIGIDLAFIAAKIAAEHVVDGYTNSMQLADVAYGDGGWLFGLHWGANNSGGVGDGTPSNRNPAGFFWTKDITATLGNSQWYGTSNIPGAYITRFDGHGWVAYSNYTDVNGTMGAAIFFNSNADPTQGAWRTVGMTDVANSLVGTGQSPCITDIAAGEISGVNWIVVGDGYYGGFATSDQGVTWSVIQTRPQVAYPRHVTNGNPAAIDQWNYNNPYTGEKITISGSNVPQLNGTWYVQYNGTIELYYDQALTTPLDGAVWGDVNLYVTKEITGKYGEKTINMSDVTGLVVGMAAYDNSLLWTWEGDYDDPNLIESIDSVANTVTMKYPFSGYDGDSTSVEFRPVLSRTYGDGITSLAYGAGAFVGSSWNNGVAAYRTTNMTSWTLTNRGSQSQWLYSNQLLNSVAYGTVTTHGALLRSDATTVPGYTNFLSVSDTFQVQVIGGDPEWINSQSTEGFGMGSLEIDPITGGWHLGVSVGPEGFWGTNEGYYNEWGKGTTAIYSFNNNEGYNAPDYGTPTADSVAIRAFGDGNDKYVWRFIGSVYGDYGEGYFTSPRISVGGNDQWLSNYNYWKDGYSAINRMYFYDGGEGSLTSGHTLYDRTIYTYDGNLQLYADFGSSQSAGSTGWSSTYSTHTTSARLNWSDTNYATVDWNGVNLSAEGYSWQFTDDCSGDNYGTVYAPDSSLYQVAGYWKFGDWQGDWENAYIEATDYIDSNPTDIHIHAGNTGGSHDYYFDRQGTLTLGQGGRAQMSCYWSVGDYTNDYYYTWVGSGVHPHIGGVDPKDILVSADNNHWFFDRNGNFTLPPGGDIMDSSYQSVLRDVPQTLQDGGSDYTIQLTDRNRHVYVVSSGDVLVPTNASIAFPLGACIMVVTDDAHSLHIRPVDSGTTTLVLSKFGVDNNISLAADAVATLLKVATDRWIVSIA